VGESWSHPRPVTLWAAFDADAPNAQTFDLARRCLHGRSSDYARVDAIPIPAPGPAFTDVPTGIRDVSLSVITWPTGTHRRGLFRLETLTEVGGCEATVFGFSGRAASAPPSDLQLAAVAPVHGEEAAAFADRTPELFI
jgi:hypothetical protein